MPKFTLQRTEVVALVDTLMRLSESIHASNEMYRIHRMKSHPEEPAQPAAPPPPSAAPEEPSSKFEATGTPSLSLQVADARYVGIGIVVAFFVIVLASRLFRNEDKPMR
jgi:hypothetical protein